MKKNKKNKRNKGLKFLYLICVIIVVIAGIYYENGYKDIKQFISDIKTKGMYFISNEQENITNNNQSDTTSKREYKKVNGSLEMHVIDVGQR